MGSRRWRARRREKAAAGDLGLGVTARDVELALAIPHGPLWPAVAARPPKDFVIVCRCPSVERRHGQSNGICACRHPIAGANCGCVCAEGRGAWCEHCHAVAALDPPSAEEKAAARRGLEEIEREELEPEFLAAGPERGLTARRMHEAGMRAKSVRYARCGRMGFPANCRLSVRHSFFQPLHCGLRYCPNCGPATVAALLERHLPRIAAFLEREPVRPRSTLAMITLTLRCNGAMPSAAEVRQFNRLVRRWFRLLQRRGLFQAGAVLAGGKPGLIWTDEFGAEEKGRRAGRTARGRNLHAHGVYYGPLLDWHKARDLWRELTGATGLYVRQVKGWKQRRAGDPRWRRELSKALYYALKYSAKAPHATPERIAMLEAAFNRVRRLHTAGAFFNLPPVPDDAAAEGGAAALPRHECPLCGGKLVFGRAKFALETLIADGRRDLEQARREAGRAHALGAEGCRP
jgi:hypothetical protein